MFILARGGQSYARLRFNVGPGGELEIPVSVDYARPFGGCDHDARETEYLTNVQPQQFFHGAASIVEPLAASPFAEEPTSDWYDDWFEYLKDEDAMKGLIA